MIRECLTNNHTVHPINRISLAMRCIVIAAFCFAADSSAQAAEKNLPIKGEVFTIKDRTAFLILPKKSKSGNLIPWLWYAPTLRGLPGKEEKWMFDQFVNNGIAIAGVDVGESYGNPKGRAIYSALYKELVEKRGLAKQACLLARSRGGLMLYNWAAENPKSVACIAGIYPVCNLSSYPGLGRACGAYGMTKEQLAAQLTEHNPIDRLARLAKAKVPIFHIHGDSDRVVPLDKNSSELKKRYVKLGGKMTLEIVKGQGHNMWSGWFHSQNLVDFVITHAREDKPKETDWIVLEKQFRELPMEARRLTGPLFWMHGDVNETKERLEEYVEKVAEGGNGCFTAESRPHSDWLGPRWYKDLDICLQKAKELDLKMWIFDERWWPSQSIGGQVPPRYAAKTLVANVVDVKGPRLFEADGYGGERYIAAVAGRLNANREIEGESLLDLAPFIKDGKFTWKTPAGNWQIIKFTHKQAPGLGQRGGRELSVDGASQDCTDWFIQTVYQPHFDHFKDDFGKAIPGFFYDEPETKGDWGTELNVILKEWGVDWKKAYVAYKFKLAGDDDIAARYQYMEAIADAWGRVMYGGMTKWCHEHDVVSIGHFMEHGYLYLRPDYCAGDMMRVQKYSDMGGIDLVVRQMYPGQRPHSIYQTPKLCSSISHVYGKKDDLAMCEIFGGYNQVLTYPQMKWLTDQMQVRGVNFMIPHSFNPKAPHDRDYPPYFYNDGHEPRWPLYRVYADWTSRLSLMLTGGRHVCPVAILFSGNARRVGKYVTPEDMTSALQDALYDCDWLPFEAFEGDASLDGKNIKLHQERYQVLIVPPTEVIPYATLAKAKAFFDKGGVVIGYGFLPSKSGTVGHPSEEIAKLRDAIWGNDTKVGTEACKTSAAGGRSYFLPQNPEANAISAALHKDAGIPPVVEVLEGETDNWLHVLHRVKDSKDIFLICNQDHKNEAKTFRLKFTAEGFPEIWDAMRNEMFVVPVKRLADDAVELSVTLEPMESVLLVFRKEKRALPERPAAGARPEREPIAVVRDTTPPEMIVPSSPQAKRTTVKSDLKLNGCVWTWFPEGNPAQAAPVGTRYFRGRCTVPAGRKVKRAHFVGTCDNAFALYVNGKEAGKSNNDSEGWRVPIKIDMTKLIVEGPNIFAIAAVNMSDAPNPAGLIGRYEIAFEHGEPLSGSVNATWKAADKEQTKWKEANFDDTGWPAAKALGNYGCAPWGNFAAQGRRGGRLTFSPVSSDPFCGHCDLPADVDLSESRVYLESDEPAPEAAAHVTVNGEYAGGFIGRPCRLEVTRLLKSGRNDFVFVPFAPKRVRLLVYRKTK